MCFTKPDILICCILVVLDSRIKIMMMTLNHKARIFQGAMEETPKDQEALETRRDPTSASRSKTINTFQRSNSLHSHPA
jgi:hypothetical protein